MALRVYTIDMCYIPNGCSSGPWGVMDAARGARQKRFLLKKLKSPQMTQYPPTALKVLKVSTIKGGLALKVLLRAPKYAKA